MLLARHVAAILLAVLAALCLILAVLFDHDAQILSAFSFFAAGAFAYLAYLLARRPRRRERDAA